MISAIVLAAGRSTRMGRQKMLMPWGETTVLGRVIDTLKSAKIEGMVVVTNSEIAATIAHFQLPILLNDSGEMLASIKVGLQNQKPSAEAVLLCLGDQPQVQEGSVRSVCDAFRESKSELVVPSHQMRRGHPWLIARSLWGEILAMEDSQTMRDFLNRHQAEILYVNCDTPTILQDLDTPEDYSKYKP